MQAREIISGPLTADTSPADSAATETTRDLTLRHRWEHLSMRLRTEPSPMLVRAGNGGYGNCVIIQNDDGNITYYAHQSETACEVGDKVKAGQLIGYVGTTGDSTGNHLHFEVRRDGVYYDPAEFVSQ